jgi:hypothetical protein
MEPKGLCFRRMTNVIKMVMIMRIICNVITCQCFYDPQNIRSLYEFLLKIREKNRLVFFNAWLKMTSTKTVKRIHTLPVILWEPADRHSRGQVKPPRKIISVIFISMMMKCLWHKAETKQILTKQAICVQRYIEARLCKHYCSRKAMSITQPECMYL